MATTPPRCFMRYADVRTTIFQQISVERYVFFHDLLVREHRNDRARRIVGESGSIGSDTTGLSGAANGGLPAEPSRIYTVTCTT
jgi:hypothetical protein